jgi:hypothetical protein
MAENSHFEETERYERRDLSPRAIALFAVGLAVVIGVVAAIVTVFQIYAGSRFARRQPPQRPPTVTRESTEPQLQVGGASELRTMREAEERALNTYGWVDPQAGMVRIPIDRAIEILAQKGLPARQETKDQSQK